MDTVESLAAKFSTLLPHLDERQQRLYLASEARSLGHGGIAAVARAAGVSRQTVTNGVDELESGQAPLGRVRRPGAGRKRVVAADPGLRPALLALVEPDERGDPMSPLRWTVKSTRSLAEELTGQGHRISADTVADVLREEGFSLQGNAKTVEGRQNPDRDAQFRYLNEQVKDHQAAGQPVISVDTKKKESAPRKRLAISLAQLGGMRRNIPGSNGLPGSERKKGTIACQRSSGRVQVRGTGRCGTRATR